MPDQNYHCIKNQRQGIVAYEHRLVDLLEHQKLHQSPLATLLMDVVELVEHIDNHIF